MKEIVLTRGKKTTVDDEDYRELSKFKWHAHKSYKRNGLWYVARTGLLNGKRIEIAMHRQIISPVCGMMVDHVDGNGLNNCRSNLRVVTNRENMQNCKTHRDGKSVCVYYNSKRKRPYRAYIWANGKQLHLGSYSTKEDASHVYSLACWLYGDDAKVKV